MWCDASVAFSRGIAELSGKCFVEIFNLNLNCELFGRVFVLILLVFILQTKRDLEKLVDEINAGRPQCPVGLNTLVIPRKVTLAEHGNQPYVYLNCGHVQGNFCIV